MEIWKDIKGWEGSYQVSNKGRVRSVDRFRKGCFGCDAKVKGKIFKPHSRNKYLYVNLTKDNKPTQYAVHRLVAEAFIPNPKNKPQVNHKNLNKSDNRVENLEWVTIKENWQHAFNNNRLCIGKCGEEHPNSKYTEKQILKIRRLVFQGLTQRKTAEITGVNFKTVNYIVNRKAWNHV